MIMPGPTLCGPAQVREGACCFWRADIDDQNHFPDTSRGVYCGQPR